MRYRAAPAEALLVRPLDAFTAIFHRPSGQTHLLLEPAPEILDALGDGWLTLSGIADALSARFDLDGAEGLAERLEELAAAGLVEAR